MSLRVFTCVLLISLAGTSAINAQGQKNQKSKRKPKPTGIVWVNKTDKQLPPGVLHRTFASKAAKQKVGYCIYLPPGYNKDTARRYPVIYNLHGNGGNEFHAFEDVKLLHRGIQSGKWPPMIVVLPNGGQSTFYKDSYDGRFPVETMFVKDLIPFIDRTYRTIAARHGRCIEGFSMGGRGATRLAMKYPELFCSLFCQAGTVPHTADAFDPTRPQAYPNNYLGPDKQNYIDNDAFLLLKKNAKQIRGSLRIRILCGTKDGGHIKTIRQFHQALLDNKVDHTYTELEGFGHQRVKILAHQSRTWFDYHVESLRHAKP